MPEALNEILGQLIRTRDTGKPWTRETIAPVIDEAFMIWEAVLEKGEERSRAKRAPPKPAEPQPA